MKNTNKFLEMEKEKEVLEEFMKLEEKEKILIIGLTKGMALSKELIKNAS